MRKAIRLFLFFEGIAFMIASLIHLGAFMHGHEHRPAGTAEGVIGIVLLMGLMFTWVLSKWTRAIGIAVQTFALLGTCVGIYTIAIGVGPRTMPDIAFHVAIVIALVAGLVVACRAQKQIEANAPHQPPRS